MKLVTIGGPATGERGHILIHTSVKLVTRDQRTRGGVHVILIHTSVKLVTVVSIMSVVRCAYFNPHEREARDEAR